MFYQILLILVLNTLVSAKTFIPGPRFQQLLDDTDLKGKDQFKFLAELDKELDLENVKSLSVETHLVLVPPPMVVHLCLQDAPIWTEILTFKSSCPMLASGDLDVGCMLGRMAVKDSTAGLDHALLGPALLECREWWSAAVHADRTLGAEAPEMGRCLLQSVSVACQHKMDNIIAKALRT